MNQRYKRFGAFSASDNPEQLGSTIKAMIMGVSFVVILLAQYVFHVTWTVNDVNDLSTAVGTLVTCVAIAYGLLKKGFVWIYDRWISRNA